MSHSHRTRFNPAKPYRYLHGQSHKKHQQIIQLKNPKPHHEHHHGNKQKTSCDDAAHTPHRALLTILQHQHPGPGNRPRTNHDPRSHHSFVNGQIYS